MPPANDSTTELQPDAPRRQLAQRLGRLVAREYLSRQGSRDNMNARANSSSVEPVQPSGQSAAGSEDPTNP